LGNRNNTWCGTDHASTYTHPEFHFNITYSWSRRKCRHIGSSIPFGAVTHQLAPDPLDVNLEEVYIINNSIMNQTYLEQTSVCQPGRNYQWGFSSQLLFLFCLLTIVYASVLTVLHWDLYNCGRANSLEHRPGLYRDILDLADEINEELDLKDEDVYLTPKVLQERLTTMTGSIAVEVEATRKAVRRHRKLQLGPRRQRIAAIEAEAERDYEAFLRKKGSIAVNMEALLPRRETARRCQSVEREPRQQERADVEAEAVRDYDAFLRN
jgi:hypothetical protein